MFFRKYFSITDSHREALVQSTGEERWTSASDAQVQQYLLEASTREVEHVLSPRDLEALRYGYRERVTDVHLEHVRDLPQVLPGLFADAAERAQKVGFDGVELHYAHAYTMSSFLSATNTRTDGYGGSKEERIRLPLEAYQAVRERVGKDYVVGCRFLGDEVIPDGSHLEAATYFGVEFAKAGMDYLSISKGGKFDDAKQPRVGEAVYPYTGPSGHECMPTVYIDEKGPFGRNVNLAATIRSAVRGSGMETPIVTSGGICSFWQAEEILESGQADIVAAARQSIADPDWFRKVRLGHGSEVRRCLFTNYCESLDQRHKQVTCQLWDRDFSDDESPGIMMANDGARRLVAPGWSRDSES